MVDTPALADVGFAEAIVIVKTILGEPGRARRLPTWRGSRTLAPEVAWCGLTEEEAREQGPPRRQTTKQRFAGDARAMILGDTEGVVKLVTDVDGQVLGVHLAGPWATELLGEGYLSVNWEANAADIAALVHPHHVERGVLAKPRLVHRSTRPLPTRPRGERSGRDDAQLGETVTEGTSPCG